MFDQILSECAGREKYRLQLMLAPVLRFALDAGISASQKHGDSPSVCDSCTTARALPGPHVKTREQAEDLAPLLVPGSGFDDWHLVSKHNRRSISSSCELL